jgi:integrase/recombinase XerD
VARLLAACDPATLTGSRDLAVLTMVARLGLRSVEVARLELDDIDWRAGEFTVRGKARRVDRLPLVTDVGETLAGWLQRRPATTSRRLFVTTKAPIVDIRPSLVSETLRRVCLRCGVEVIGAHRLRHGLATDMLQRGASLVEVGQVLRHRDLATTAVYAKVDVDNLRRLAQPWPGASA